MTKELTLFEAVNEALKHNDIIVRGKVSGLLTYGSKGLHIWTGKEYHQLQESDLIGAKFHKKV